MKRIHILSAMIALLVLAGCTAANRNLSEEGVSRQLAMDRKARIADLCYDLSFDIPASQDSTILGAESISFSYKPEKDGQLVIDFRQPADAIISVIANGHKADYQTSNGHILIPDNQLSDGANTVELQFLAGERSLNRNPDYLYTLFVPDRASTVFPCFDQPDMKATYRLKLTVPEQWVAVSNTVEESEKIANGRKTIMFGPTEPLSTYLFAFAAGKFEYQSYTEDGRTIGAYYRETDPDRIAQLPDIFKEVMASLKWQEEFSAQPYPFAKYDLVILPGFQFGGMEHTGATFYNDSQMFLGKHPTPDNLLRRTSLIAHETTHMWFGDYVTMAWFDDVWTKEVFANYFAAAITRERLPQFDHDLEWMRNYAAAAMSEDRSPGRTTIRQELDNMKNAGLIYNNIIYNKAPVMLAKLVEVMGDDAFREGIRKYVAAFPYGNATWDQLVEILQSVTDADVKGFSDVWVYQKGMPHLDFSISADSLKVRHRDPLGNGNLWPQQFKVAVVQDDRMQEVQVVTNGTDSVITLPLGFALRPDAVILPNSDGKGYGLFTTSAENDKRLMKLMASQSVQMPKITRLSTLMNLNENYLAGRISASEWLECCMEALEDETDPQTAATLVKYLSHPLGEVAEKDRGGVEARLLAMTSTIPVTSARKSLLSLLARSSSVPATNAEIYAVWKSQSSPLLDERDYMTMAYEVALRHPAQAEEILAEQRLRLKNPDRIREFDFISRAAVADTAAALDSLFESLSIADNRRIEPWTQRVLAMLNHPLREEHSVKYIYPALSLLPEIQRTGDIFFPGNWCSALLGSHRSEAAARELRRFLDDNPDLNPLLRNKILNGAYSLIRANPRIFPELK